MLDPDHSGLVFDNLAATVEIYCHGWLAVRRLLTAQLTQNTWNA